MINLKVLSAAAVIALVLADGCAEPKLGAGCRACRGGGAPVAVAVAVA